MQCQESKKVLDAYVDNELDLVQSVAVEEHLAECRDCSRKVEDRRALSAAIHRADLRFTAPPDLVKGVRKALRLSEATTLSEKWLWFKNAALGFAAATIVFLLAAAVIGLWFHVPESRKIAQAATDDYIRAMLMENRGIDVASSDQHTVKPWFNGKTSFSPEAPSFADKGFPLAGGRVDFLNNQTVAVLIYKRNQHFIDVFLYPEASNTQRGEIQQRGYNVIYWDSNGMQYWAVSDLNLAELRQLAKLLGA
jgi:anti-sigma factor RsiW